MATPSRTNLLLTIKSTLEGITSGNGYNTTVANVEPWIRSPSEVADGERPHIGFGFDPETYETQGFEYQWIRAKWVAVGSVPKTASWETMSAAVNLFLDDIMAAVLADDTLGGYAVQTVCTQSDTSESDRNWREGGYVLLEFETTYERTTGLTV